MSFDDSLRQALRRQPGPPDLAERVRNRIDGAIAGKPPARHGSGRRWMAAAAFAALVVAGAARYYAYRASVAEAERVTGQLSLALEIASEKLALVQRRVEQLQP